MASGIGLIGRSRLKNIPKEARISHEYCFFLHDQCVALLKQYEETGAHLVRFKFRDDVERERFTRLAEEKHSLDVMREIGRIGEARRVILNTITMAMVSDCMHHIYESLRCLEKRKFVVGMGLLRKPLMDNLTYLSWMLGDEDAFYSDFTSGNPELLTQDKVGPLRREIISKAISKTQVTDLVKVDLIHSVIFDRKADPGFYGFFQHAIHLVTTWKSEIKTASENFNFIFKNPNSNDIYLLVYKLLPSVMLYLSHVVLELFDNMTKMEPGAKTAFIYRSRLGIYLAHSGKPNIEFVVGWLKKMLADDIICSECRAPLKITAYNSGRIVLADSFKCTACGRLNGLAFSWIF